MQWSPHSHNSLWDISNLHRSGDSVEMWCRLSTYSPQLWFAPASEKLLLPMEMPSGSLMLYSRLRIKGRVHCPGRSAPLSLSLRNPPPSRWRLWSIRPRLPLPHVIFFLWHGSPLHAVWYSGAGMPAPSQIHQLQSECHTTARETEGWEKRMMGGGAGQGLADILQLRLWTKASTDREMERDRGIWEDKGKSEKEPSFISAGCHFC